MFKIITTGSIVVKSKWFFNKHVIIPLGTYLAISSLNSTLDIQKKKDLIVTDSLLLIETELRLISSVRYCE